MSYTFSQLSSIIVAVPPPRPWLTHSLLTSVRSGEGHEDLQVPAQESCWCVTHAALVTNLYQGTTGLLWRKWAPSQPDPAWLLWQMRFVIDYGYSRLSFPGLCRAILVRKCKRREKIKEMAQNRQIIEPCEIPCSD